MLLYNNTYKVDHFFQKDWAEWMQHAYIPHLMDSGIFEEYKFCRLLGVDESDGITYTLQLTVSSRPAFDIYQEKYALGHQRMIDEKFRGRYVTFRTLLDVLASGD